MVDVLRKLWSSFVVAALLLLFIVFAAGAITASRPPGSVSPSDLAADLVPLWCIGVGAHQSVVWSKLLTFRRAFGIWAAAAAIGIAVFYGLKILAQVVFLSGQVGAGLSIGFSASTMAIIGTPAVGWVLVRRSSRLTRS
jgi:DMSO/TMAO reductase YedYZ heme-binding membrane subunit